MADFTEVAPRIWVARHEWLDVNVTLIGGERGLLLIDTHSSGRAARGVVEDIGRLGAGAVVGVVNTHEHWDHTFGNAVIREAYGDIPIHAQEWAAEHTVQAGERIKEVFATSDDPHAEEVIETEIVPADHTLVSARVVDLGDRLVELVHPGRGHTAGDLMVRIPDADTVLAGDLVEQSGPPAYGADSWPLDWPLTLDVALGLLTPASVVVPGHGSPVDREFVEEQRNAIGVVAQTIGELAGRGVPVDEAVAHADWPFPAAALAEAVRRGYTQLPRGQRGLPLV